MQVAVIGNGNWGTTVAKIIAENVVKHNQFNNEVFLWTHEEIYDGKKLSELINKEHLNPIYLPGVKLLVNIVSKTEIKDLESVDIYVFCLPHQFLDALKKLKTKKGSFGINLCKGLVKENGDLLCPSEYISSLLNIECACLSGANIAGDIAKGLISETTIGYKSKETSGLFLKMFKSETFIPVLKEFNRGIEISGALKNVFSVAYGIVKGKGWGVNALSMVFRRALNEMEGFCKLMDTKVDILSCECLGDLLVSCESGRNSRFGFELGKTGCTVAEYEKLMKGQKLQGPGTAKAVIEWMNHKGHDLRQFPLISAIYKICYEGKSTEIIYEILINE